MTIDMEMPKNCGECVLIACRESGFDKTEQFCPYSGETVKSEFEKLPSCPLRENRAYWKANGNCSNCGYNKTDADWVGVPSKFCPNCGSRMRKKK